MEATLKNYDAARLRRLASEHHLRPFSNNTSVADEEGGQVYTRAEGVYTSDVDNRCYLDKKAGLWWINVVYGRQVDIPPKTYRPESSAYAASTSCC